MKTKHKIMMVILAVFLVGCIKETENKDKENKYIDKSKFFNAAPPSKNTVIGKNNENDIYILNSFGTIQLSNEGYSTRLMTSRTHTVTFENEVTQWWLSRIYYSEMKYIINDIENDIEIDFILDDLLLENGALSDLKGIVEYDYAQDSNDKEVFLLKIEKKIVYEDLEEIEQFKSEPGNYFELPDKFGPEYYVFNLAEYVQSKRDMTFFDSKEGIKKVSDFSNYTSRRGIKKNNNSDELSRNITHDGKFLLSEYTNFNDLYPAIDNLDDVKVKIVGDRVVYSVVFYANLELLQNEKLMSIFPTLYNDVESFEFESKASMLELQFNSIESDYDLIMLLIEDPNSIIMDERFEFKGHYKELAETEDITSLEELMIFLADNKKE